MAMTSMTRMTVVPMTMLGQVAVAGAPKMARIYGPKTTTGPRVPTIEPIAPMK